MIQNLIMQMGKGIIKAKIKRADSADLMGIYFVFFLPLQKKEKTPQILPQICKPTISPTPQDLTL
ncbi:MAG: hypothetical protein K9I71_12220 [Ignavibacteriales bacterium]|nr:hypothetical protein [Ignavibacteriales bacterium]MCF8438448.1 hypothetical protein [Ignavibacteriales bacterium]